MTQKGSGATNRSLFCCPVKGNGGSFEWLAFLYSHGCGRALNQEEIPMEQGTIGDKILVGLLVWFVLGQWLLCLTLALPLLMVVAPFVPPVVIIWIIYVLLKG
jgi:hypothetical protein